MIRTILLALALVFSVPTMTHQGHGMHYWEVTVQSLGDRIGNTKVIILARNHNEALRIARATYEQGNTRARVLGAKHLPASPNTQGVSP